MEQDKTRLTQSLAGKRVLLTGGTTGIGRATLIALAGAGARVLTLGRHAEPLREALQAAGLPPEAGLMADASRPEDIDRVFAAVDEQLGGLDILINNAAVGGGALAEATDQEWRYSVETNLLGYMACARAALGRLEQAGGGQILFVSSIAAENLSAGESVYAATKGGTKAFALTLRKEVAEQGIRVTVIEPGSVGSDMQEMPAAEQRAAIDRMEMLFAEDLADAIVWTLSRPERTDIVMLRIEPARQKSH